MIILFRRRRPTNRWSRSGYQERLGDLIGACRRDSERVQRACAAWRRNSDRWAACEGELC
jgi:hypothetical protein